MKRCSVTKWKVEQDTEYWVDKAGEAKRRTLKILVFGIHPSEFAKMGLVSLSSLLDESISCYGICQMKSEYGKSVRSVFDEEKEVNKTSLLLY